MPRRNKRGSSTIQQQQLAETTQAETTQAENDTEPKRPGFVPIIKLIELDPWEIILPANCQSVSDKWQRYNLQAFDRRKSFDFADKSYFVFFCHMYRRNQFERHSSIIIWSIF